MINAINQSNFATIPQNAHVTAIPKTPQVVFVEPNTKVETAPQKKAQKPGFFKSLFKGVGMQFVASLPIIGSYKVGKELLEQQYLKEDIKALEEGKTPENKKPGFCESLGKGILFKLGQSVPIYSTYRIGKEILEQKYIKEDLEAVKEGRNPEHKKVGFGKALWQGFKFKLSTLVPALNPYLTGKDMIEQDKLQEEVKTIMA